MNFCIVNLYISSNDFKKYVNIEHFSEKYKIFNVLFNDFIYTGLIKLRFLFSKKNKHIYDKNLSNINSYQLVNVIFWGY